MAATSWASEAALNALLKYAPQRAALKELQRSAEEQFGASVQAGKTEGTLGVQAAKSAVAPTKQVFSQAQTEGERGRTLTAPVLAALAPGNPFAAAAANEAAAGGERRATSQANALSDLQQRQVAATELPAFTRSAAMATLAKELAKLQSQGRTLEGEQAASQQSETDKLRGEANKLGVTERGQNLTLQAAKEGHQASERNTAAHDKTAKEDAEIAHGAKGTGIKYQSADAQGKAAAHLDSIRGLADALFREGHNRTEAEKQLTEAEPSIKLKSGGTLPGRSGYAPDVLLKAALDEAQLGHITRQTLSELHNDGYSVKALNLKGPPPAPTPGQLGKNVSKALSGVF